MNQDIEQLKYPIGKFQAKAEINEDDIRQWIAEIVELPQRLQKAVAGLNDAQLDTPYRPGGWTLRQVVHHLVDSHMNAYIRFKLAVTEENPHIRPYEESLWAECEDGKFAPIAPSLLLLDALHQRWVVFLQTLKFSDFERSYFHPEHQKSFTLGFALGLYAWHSAHHLAHITQTQKQHNWL